MVYIDDLKKFNPTLSVYATALEPEAIVKSVTETPNVPGLGFHNVKATTNISPDSLSKPEISTLKAVACATSVLVN